MKNWTASINAITKQAFAEFGELSSVQLHWQPNANTWSIAQNLEHIILVNESYYPILKSLKAGTYKTPFFAKISVIVLFFGKTILKAVQPDRQKKMKTFSIWKPVSSNHNNDILNKFQRHQNELIQKIEEAQAFVAAGVVIASPANKYIVYTLETAFDIIVAHEQRHLEQSKELLNLIKNNTNVN